MYICTNSKCTLTHTHNHTDKTDITQDFTEHAHIASDTQWEQKLTDNKNCTLSSMGSNAWKQFKLMGHGWYVEDPV